MTASAGHPMRIERTHTWDQQDEPDYVFTVEMKRIEKCGMTCRKVTVALSNEGTKDAHNVTVDARLTAGNNLVYAGDEDVGTLAAGETYTDTRRVTLEPDDIAAIRQNDYVVTLQMVINSTEASGVISQSIDVQNNEVIEAPIPELKKGDAKTVVHEGSKYLLINNIPNQPPNRYAVTTPDYKLTSVARTKDVIGKQFWPTLTWETRWEQRLQTTIDVRNTAKTNKNLVKAAQLGWDIGEIIILLRTGATGLAVGSVLDAASDAIGWAYQEATDPYQEAFQGMTACLGNNITAESLASRITSHEGMGQELQQVFDAYQTMDDAVQSGLSLAKAWKQMLSALQSGSTALSTGVGTAIKGTSGLFFGFALQSTVGVLESAFKTKAHIHSMTYALATQRIPLLKRIIDVEQRLNTSNHVLGDGWLYYLNLQFNFQMMALGYAAASQYYQTLHNHPTGILWDITQDAQKKATEFRKKANLQIENAHLVAQILGSAQTKVKKMTQQSINADFRGSS